MRTRCRALLGRHCLRCRSRCVKQTVTLTNNAPTNMVGGTTWYLHGSDNSLLFEKEVKANGTTENKHYLMAGGQVFAVFTSRTGTLDGLAASTTSYFQHDQLGSIAVVTDENGVVKERLAYDPWGKRRNIMSSPGTPDTRDLLVGKYTNRGFTEHEHLDEIGMIHMNGRIYDPLIGRFMSADPHVTDPYNLQSFNRYAYVLNNPLSLTDPTGYEPWGTTTNSEGNTVHTQFSDTGNGTVVNTYTGNIYSHNSETSSHTHGSGVAATNVAGPAGEGTAPIATYSSTTGTWSPTAFGQSLAASSRPEIAQHLYFYSRPVSERIQLDAYREKLAGAFDGFIAAGGALGIRSTNGVSPADVASVLAKPPLLQRAINALKSYFGGERSSINASGPLGSTRLQFNQPDNPSYQPIRNSEVRIDGLDYSGHALDRMQDRGVMPSVVKNTISEGDGTASRFGTTVYSDPVNNVSAVVNAQGKVVTVRYRN